MDKKQFLETRNKPVVELKKTITELQNKLWQLKVDLASGKIKNVKEIHAVKKDIAKLLTCIQQKGEN